MYHQKKFHRSLISPRIFILSQTPTSLLLVLFVEKLIITMSFFLAWTIPWKEVKKMANNMGYWSCGWRNSVVADQTKHFPQPRSEGWRDKRKDYYTVLTFYYKAKETMVLKRYSSTLSPPPPHYIIPSSPLTKFILHTIFCISIIISSTHLCSSRDKHI